MNTLPIRFQDKIIPEPNSGCWLWTGAVRADGYGIIWEDGTNQYSHRAVYRRIKGAINDGLHLDHRCRLRCCCNPDHLEPVTLLINTRRGRAGKHKAELAHCKRGHEFTAENTRSYIDRGIPVRQCRACDKIRKGKL